MDQSKDEPSEEVGSCILTFQPPFISLIVKEAMLSSRKAVSRTKYVSFKIRHPTTWI